MPSSGNSKPPFDRLPDGRNARMESAAGIAQVRDGSRVVFAAPALIAAFHSVLEAEAPAAWQKTFSASAVPAGRAFGFAVDRELASRGQPALTDQPLEICLALVERHFATQGWGLLTCDLTDAPEHGLVVARLQKSCFVAALSQSKIEKAPSGKDFADPLPAGFLQGFLEYVSGQPLGCVEIGCARPGLPSEASAKEAPPLCTFVVTSTERLDAIAPFLGRTKPEEIIAKLKS